MPWLTPDSIPEGDDCRPLLIPADSVWLALVSGALTELTLKYNWEKFGALTVDETVAKMQSIIDNYYDSPCTTCTVPGGYRVVRISPDGHLQELDDAGAWQGATGEYVIPPPTARTDGTPPDQNCLAAKNASNAIAQLYENLSESFSSELSTDEALVAFIAAAVAVIGFEFAPITWAIAAVAFVIFEALFQALQYVTADLWTEDFTKQFTCLLLNCAINTDGVVTFDWDCFNAALLAQVNTGGLSEVQMRLYVQIGYILYFIGGVDGLNLAGRTTAITNDDCSYCEGVHCWHWDSPTPTAQFVSGGFAFTQFDLAPSAPITILSCTIGFEFTFVSGDEFLLELYNEGTYLAVENMYPTTTGVETIYNDPTGTLVDAPIVYLADHNNYPTIVSIEITYTGNTTFPEGFSCDG